MRRRNLSLRYSEVVRKPRLPGLAPSKQVISSTCAVPARSNLDQKALTKRKEATIKLKNEIYYIKYF